jgi:hypothetical protein
MDFIAGADWLNFLPAVQAFIHGQNPYLVGEGFCKVYEPFWTYIFLVPFAVLPFWTGRILLFIVSLVSFAFTAIKMGASRVQLILFLTSAAVIGGLYEGNVDWLVTMGIWMPPQIGLFFVMMKPQIGCCIAIYWLYMAWKQDRWQQMIRTFAPVTVAYLISFLFYGFWPLQLWDMPHNPVNGGIFPWTVPMGLVILYFSLKGQDKRLSAFSSPLVSPYVTTYNFSISLLSLFNRPFLFVATWIALWIPALLKLLIK